MSTAQGNLRVTSELYTSSLLRCRQANFADDTDRMRFLELLGRETQQQRWRCDTYCLMNDRDHLLLETPEANLSRGMGRLNMAYSQGFNRRHERLGALGRQARAQV